MHIVWQPLPETCKLPFKPNHHFTAEIKHRPVVPDNVKNWQVSENDTQINNFLTLKEEFSSTNIDTSTIDDQQTKWRKIYQLKQQI